ncbi:MAG: 50S ribosomal protein L30 [Thermonemataceae bacterium]|nr:50S ribosomal protein L30 [Thermonemataceae bacterium]
MAKVKVTQVRSLIGRPERQHKIIKALGLGRIGKTKEFEVSPSIQGMLAKVTHLVNVENI